MHKLDYEKGTINPNKINPKSGNFLLSYILQKNISNNFPEIFSFKGRVCLGFELSDRLGFGLKIVWFLSVLGGKIFIGLCKVQIFGMLQASIMYTRSSPNFFFSTNTRIHPYCCYFTESIF